MSYFWDKQKLLCKLYALTLVIALLLEFTLIHIGKSEEVYKFYSQPKIVLSTLSSFSSFLCNFFAIFPTITGNNRFYELLKRTLTQNEDALKCDVNKGSVKSILKLMAYLLITFSILCVSSTVHLITLNFSVYQYYTATNINYYLIFIIVIDASVIVKRINSQLRQVNILLNENTSQILIKQQQGNCIHVLDRNVRHITSLLKVQMRLYTLVEAFNKEYGHRIFLSIAFAAIFTLQSIDIILTDLRGSAYRMIIALHCSMSVSFLVRYVLKNTNLIYLFLLCRW